jgi:quinol monooxygenase YgiN
MSILPMARECDGAYVSLYPFRVTSQEIEMTVHKALFARIEAKPGKEAAVQELLTGALALANQEKSTTVWFALRLGPSTFGVFDAFADEAGRQAHLAGPIAKALIANAPELLKQPPQIDPIDVLAAKL